MSHDAGATAPQERVAHLGAAPGGRKRTAGSAGSPAGRAGLAITALSIVATVAVGLAGPSAMEPALPQKLYFMVDQAVQNKLKAPTGRLQKLLADRTRSPGVHGTPRSGQGPREGVCRYVVGSD